MEEITTGVNWLATGVGALVAYILGWLWYSPLLFLNRWLVGIGLTPEDAKQPPVAAMAVQALGTFLLAWIVGLTAVTNSLMTCLLVVAMLMTMMVSGGLYMKKQPIAMVIEVGYVAAMVIVMIVAQALL